MDLIVSTREVTYLLCISAQSDQNRRYPHEKNFAMSEGRFSDDVAQMLFCICISLHKRLFETTSEQRLYAVRLCSRCETHIKCR